MAALLGGGMTAGPMTSMTSPTSTGLLSGVSTSLNPSSPTGGQVDLLPGGSGSTAPSSPGYGSGSTLWGNPKATSAAKSGSLMPAGGSGSMSWPAGATMQPTPAANVNGAQPGSTVYGGGTGPGLTVDAQGNVTLPSGQTMTAAQYTAYGSNFNPGASDAAYTNVLGTGAAKGQSAVGNWVNGQWQPETNQYALNDWAQQLGTTPGNLVNPNGGAGALSNGWSISNPSAATPAAVTPATTGAAAASGAMGTGGTNPGGASAATGASMQPAVSATPAATQNSGSPTPSNAGGDIQGTMASVSPSTSAVVGSGTTTSASSLLPTPYTATSFGAQQPVTTPSPNSYVAGYQAQAAGPTAWNVQPNQTVQGQYAQLMAAGNPAIQAAEQATLRSYAAHGGGNDLMAQNAAAMSGSAVALSIAGQDAATFAAAGQFNASAANTFNAQLNQFIGNAQLSSQNFQQGMSMLNAQTNQQMTLMAAQVNASAATASINLNSFQQQTAMSLNATLATMNAQFGLNSQAAIQSAGLQSQAAWQQYGMNMRLNYLGQISNLQGNLMNTIGQIQSNPNITATQAQGAVSDAINQFNTYLTQMNAFYGALMPQGSNTTPSSNGTTMTGTGVPTTPGTTTPPSNLTSGQGASSGIMGTGGTNTGGTAASTGNANGTMATLPSTGTYNSPAYNYTYINASNWPSPSTPAANGLIATHGSGSRAIAA